jgi:hypothetical protein
VQAVGATDELIARRTEIVGQQHARSDHAAWLPGILLLRGVITAEQHEAARKWHGWAISYRKLLEGPRPVQAISLSPPRGGNPVDDPEYFAIAKSRYELCWDALASRGRHVLRACVDATFHEKPGDVALIAEGLEALRKRLGL